MTWLDVIILLTQGKGGNEVISSEAGRRWRGGRVEEGREQGKQFPGVKVELDNFLSSKVRN